MRRFSATFIVLFLLLFPGLGRSAEQGVYNPNYRYSGPQSQNIGEEEAEGKDPILATVFAVLPGVIFHGFGNYYAGDYENGTRILTMEIFGACLAVWGHNVIHYPENWGAYFGNETPQAGYWIKAGGVGLLAASWVWDVSSAGEAAQSFNKDHQIQFQLESRYDGLQLALSKRF